MVISAPTQRQNTWRYLVLLLALLNPSARAAEVTFAATGAPVQPCVMQFRAVGTLQWQEATCGSVASLEPGTYAGYIRAGERVSEHTAVFQLEHDRRTNLVLPTVAAAHLIITADDDTATIEVIKIDRLHDASKAGFRAEAKNINGRADLVVPAGTLVVIGRDRTQAIRAMSRPISVRTGATATARLTPGELTAIVATIGCARACAEADVTTTLVGDSERGPSWDVATPERITAWYDPTPDATKLRGLGPTHFVPETALRVAQRRVASVDLVARRLPRLRVTAAIKGARLTSEAMSASLLRDDASDVGKVHDLGPDLSTLFEALVPQPYVVAVDVGAFRFTQRVDLRDGADDEVHFALSPVRIHGRVTRADEPVRAIMQFRATRPVRVETDENGAYEALLWTTGRYGVSVTAEQSTFEDLINVEQDTQYDVALPQARLAVRVLDKESGAAVPDAVVAFRSRWTDADGRQRSSLSREKTGPDGVVSSQLFRSGQVELQASAGGYDESERQSVQVSENAAPTQVTISLRRAEGRQVQVTLPDGAPAAGAELFVFTDTGAPPVASARTDEQGRCRLPLNLRGVIVVRHANAASVAQRLNTGDDVMIRLDVPAHPLRIRVHDSSGRSAGAARVVLRIGDVRLAGIALALYAGAGPVTSPDGTWQVQRPSRVAHTIIAVRSLAERDALAGVADSHAVTLSFPWPPVVDVTVFD